MKPPIEAIKGALWWLEGGLADADLTNSEYRRTKKFQQQLYDYLNTVANNPVEPTASNTPIDDDDWDDSPGDWDTNYF